MIHAARATIPGGYWVNGACCREAELRELTGDEEVFVIEGCQALLPAQWTTEVLSRCLISLGGRVPVTHEAVRSLTVGDREALLLQLRRLYAGDRLQCILTCPSPDCVEKLDLDLKITDLLLPPYAEPKERYEVSVSDKDSTYHVRFRLPTGSDQEAAAALARTDLSSAADLLMRRCVELATSADGEPMECFPAALQDQLAAKMAELDGQAESTLQINCPACGRAFTAILDAATYVSQEMQAGMRHLYREVHLLAYHYHWSLSEILGMSTRSRRRYLQLLAEQLAERGAR